VTGFRWNSWNLREATKHGCKAEEIEEVIRRELRRGNFLVQGDDSLLIVGRGTGGPMLEIVFLYDAPDASVLYDDTVYVIHAMPLTTRRRRRRG
jgi:hypothetical protein